MYNVSVVLKSLEPLVLSDGLTAGMSHSTLHHIPGNMLLGAMAGRWIGSNKGKIPAESDTFKQLFLAGKVQWGNAHPLVGGDKTVPLPRCFRKFKNSSGIVREGIAQKEFLVNMLHVPADQQQEKEFLCRISKDSAADDSSGTAAAKSTARPRIKKMPDTFVHPVSITKPDIQIVWNMHVALEKGRRSAADGQLFGYEAVGKGAYFQSDIHCNSAEEQAQVVALLEKSATFRVGHARSAGYGLVNIESVTADQNKPETLSVGPEVTIALDSDYVPSCSWKTPFQSLQDDLCSLLGCPVSIDQTRSYCFHATVAGFSGVWGLPKTAKTVMQKGSVLTVLVPEPARAVSCKSTVGGCRAEGYGRIVINPQWLESASPVSHSLPTVIENNRVQIAESPLLAVMRKRTAIRNVNEAAARFLEHEEVRNMLKKMPLAKPTQSQRNRIRNMLQNSESKSQEWCTEFNDLLGKTPGKQWKNAVAYSPFSKRKEHLHIIMNNLLDFAVFNEVFGDCLAFAPIEGPVSGADLENVQKEFHRVALRELITVWSQQARSPRKNADKGEEANAVD